MELRCLSCENLFITEQVKRKFCSRKCFRKSRRTLTPKKCVGCGLDFMPTQNSKKFCSRQCYWLAKSDLMRSKPQENGNVKLAEDKVKEVIAKYYSGVSQNKLAKTYNVGSACISRIIRGVSWIDVDRPADLILGRRCDQLARLPELTTFQKEIIDGSLLGDGYISGKGHGNNWFAKEQCFASKEYINWVYDSMKPYSYRVYHKEMPNSFRKSPNYGIMLKSCRFSAYPHPVFTELRQKWYPNGKKIVPKDLKLTPLMMAVWFCDDGSLNAEKRYAVFCTNGFDLDSVEYLRSGFSEYNIKTTINLQKGKPIIRIASVSLNVLIDLIRPFVIWDCMQYKIKEK